MNTEAQGSFFFFFFSADSSGLLLWWEHVQAPVVARSQKCQSREASGTKPHNEITAEPVVQFLWLTQREKKQNKKNNNTGQSHCNVTQTTFITPGEGGCLDVVINHVLRAAIAEWADTSHYTHNRFTVMLKFWFWVLTWFWSSIGFWCLVVWSL